MDGRLMSSVGPASPLHRRRSYRLDGSALARRLIALIIALECICIPVPGETTLVAAAIYAGTTQELNIVSVILAAIVGAVLILFVYRLVTSGRR